MLQAPAGRETKEPPVDTPHDEEAMGHPCPERTWLRLRKILPVYMCGERGISHFIALLCLILYDLAGLCTPVVHMQGLCTGALPQSFGGLTA